VRRKNFYISNLGFQNFYHIRRVYGSMTGGGGADEDSGSLDSDSDLVLTLLS